MDEGRKIVLAFLIGGAIGAFVSYKITVKKAMDEFEEFTEDIETTLKDGLQDSRRIIQMQKYELVNRPDRPAGVYAKPTGRRSVNYSKCNCEENDASIRVITQEEFMSGMPLFEKISLSLYNDGILVDESSAIAEIDMEDVLGIDNLNFDVVTTVYIRNLRLKADYEINRELENYFPDVPSTEVEETEQKGEIVEFNDDGKPKRKRRS